MALHYLDTSALAKHYLVEKGSAWIDVLLLSESIAASLLVRVELASILARRVREGKLSDEQQMSILRGFRWDLSRHTVVSLSLPILDQAAALLLGKVPLRRVRSLDALHLASALSAFDDASRAGIPVGSFVASDRALLDAARSLGLPAVNPEDFL